jgi:2-methylcitrate dehydratase PrpD
MDDIRWIEIGIFKAGYEMIGGGKYVSSETVETRNMPEQLEAKRIRAADVQQLMRKVRSHENAEFTGEYPQQLTASIRIERAGAEPAVLETRSYKGFFRSPMNWGDIEARRRRLARSGVTDEQPRESRNASETSRMG